MLHVKKEDPLGKSVLVYDNKESFSDLSNNNNKNPFIIGTNYGKLMALH
ncbi:MAG TPA: hypothetical protein VH796_11150 [Nitrososphaeraceae archaeon]